MRVLGQGALRPADGAPSPQASRGHPEVCSVPVPGPQAPAGPLLRSGSGSCVGRCVPTAAAAGATCQVEVSVETSGDSISESCRDNFRETTVCSFGHSICPPRRKSMMNKSFPRNRLLGLFAGLSVFFLRRRAWFRARLQSLGLWSGAPSSVGWGRGRRAPRAGVGGAEHLGVRSGGAGALRAGPAPPPLQPQSETESEGAGGEGHRCGHSVPPTKRGPWAQTRLLLPPLKILVV